MMGNFTTFIEPYLPVLYIIHIIISIILSLILTIYIRKRFAYDEVAKKKDLLRLEEIANKSPAFRLFFKISLHKYNARMSFIFIFIFNIAIPVLGYPLSIWMAWYLNNISYEKKVIRTNILNLDEFRITFLKIERIFGEGSLLDLMTSKYAPKSKKLKALSSLAASISPENLRVVRQTLTSKDDEIRMFGYSILNKAEKALSMKINTQLEIFNKAETQKKAYAAQELASLYWEMVYTEISNDSLKDSFLKEVSKYVLIAKDYYLSKSEESDKKLEVLNITLENIKADEQREDYEDEIKLIEIDISDYNQNTIKLFVLMGKVYLNSGNYEDASREFAIAQELYEGESSFIIPYIAEIQFLLGNYSVVSSLMRRTPELGLNSTLFPIVEQWKVA